MPWLQVSVGLRPRNQDLSKNPVASAAGFFAFGGNLPKYVPPPFSPPAAANL